MSFQFKVSPEIAKRLQTFQTLKCYAIDKNGNAREVILSYPEPIKPYKSSFKLKLSFMNKLRNVPDGNIIRLSKDKNRGISYRVDKKYEKGKTVLISSTSSNRTYLKPGNTYVYPQ